MKGLLSLSEHGVFTQTEDRSNSPLANVPGVIFPNGTPSRGAEVTRAGSPATQARSTVEASQWDILSHIFGGSQYAGTYSLHEAYNLSPWMQPAIRLFAATCAARLFRIFDGKKQLEKFWLLDLIARPNKDMRMPEYSLLYITAALWRYAGEVFWHLEYGNDKKKPGQPRNAKAQPTQIWIWNRDAVQEDIDHRTGQFRGWIVNWMGMRTFIDRLDMVHYPLFDPTRHNPLGPSRGTSLWSHKRLPLTDEIKARKWNTDFYGRGLAPSLAFMAEHDVVDEDAFLDKVKARVGGKNGEPFVLSGGKWQIQQLEASQRDAQFTEGMDQNRKAILAGNTPPIAFGDNEANYANANAQIKAYFTFDIIPSLTMWASCIDAAFFYEEPNLWTDFSVEDIDELQDGKAAKIASYTTLVNSRHSPKVAAQIVGLDVDPTMPGFEDVTTSFSQIPWEYAAGGQSVSVSKAPEPEPGESAPASDLPVATTPAEVSIAPAEPQRFIRVIVPDDRAPLIATRSDDTDELLQLLFKIVRADTKKVKSRAAQFQLQAIEIGTNQIAEQLGSAGIKGIDNPRIAAFLEVRGNLITSVPEGVAERIHAKTTTLIEAGTSPEDIGRIIRKDFNVLSDHKARQIARQEVGSGLNGGRFMQMEEEGVEKREWFSSRDGKERPSHGPAPLGVDGEVVGIDEKYSNGLRYPQDPDGDNEEVQGCRCIEQMVIGGSRGVRCAAHRRMLAVREIEAAKVKGEALDERTALWRAVAQAKSVRTIERQMSDAMGGIINGWRAPILKALADLGIAK